MDDEPSFANIIRRELKARVGDIEVDAAHSLAEARRALQRNPYDVALLDLGLPDGRGTLLIPALRTHVIIYSAAADDTLREAQAETGADAALAKDSGLEAIVEAVRVGLTRRA